MENKVENQGQVVGMYVYITEANLEKFKKIQNHLNHTPEVVHGEIEPWTENDVYEQLLNVAIETYYID